MTGFCSSRILGASSWGLLLGLLSKRTKAFAPAAIRWVGLSPGRFILTHRDFPNTASGPQHQLIITDQFHRASREDIPHFIVKSDKTIAWDAWNLCIEAVACDRKREDAVRLSQCTGGPTQKWDWLLCAPGRAMIRLSGTNNKCLSVDNNATGGCNGVPVVLRNCKNDVSGMWNIEDPLLVPKNGSSHLPVSSLHLQHVLISLISLAFLGSSSLSAWLWWCQRKVSTVALRIPWDVDQGGISLMAPVALHQNVMVSTPLIETTMPAKVPVAMALSTNARSLAAADETSQQEVDQCRLIIATVSEDKPLIVVDSQGKPCQLGSSEVPQKLVVLDSSFNPPTRAHNALLTIADAGAGPFDAKLLMLGKSNADKTLVGAQLEERLAMMQLMALAQTSGAPTMLSVTCFSLFVDKARALLELLSDDVDAPKSVVYFIVGSDTLIRIFNPKYYEDPEAELRELFRMARLISVDRDDESIKRTAEILTTPLAQEFAGCITLLKFDDPNLQSISSTQVRKALADGEPLCELLLPGVEEFVVKNPHMYIAPAL